MSGLPIALGTAQFGQAYGVANRSGAVEGTAAVNLIAAAWEEGIREFDTASGYGDSEAVLGTALHLLGLEAEATVVTKAIHLSPQQVDDPGLARIALTDSIESSRRRLGLDTLPVVLFHRDADARHLDLLLELAGRGWIDRVGVSCGHDPRAAVQLAATPGIEAIQLPANVLDRRHTEGGSFGAALGRVVYVRSLYLQGLLAMAPDDVPTHLSGARASLQALDAIAVDAGLTRVELALRAGLSLDGDIRLLVGAETVGQVRENCRLVRKGPLEAALLESIADDVPVPAPELLTPALWPALAATQ